MSGKRKPRPLPVAAAPPATAKSAAPPATAKSAAAGAEVSSVSGPPAAPTQVVDLALAESAREAAAASHTGEAAAVRDTDGRVWTGTQLLAATLRLSPLRTAVVTALAGGASALSAAVVLTEAAALADIDLTLLRDLGGPAVALQVLAPSGLSG